MAKIYAGEEDNAKLFMFQENTRGATNAYIKSKRFRALSYPEAVKALKERFPEPEDDSAHHEMILSSMINLQEGYTESLAHYIKRTDILYEGLETRELDMKLRIALLKGMWDSGLSDLTFAHVSHEAESSYLKVRRAVLVVDQN